VPSFIRHPKDFWTGIIFLVVGLAAIIIGRDYAMGTAARMGPAYFPTILGGILALIGLAALVRSMFRQGEAVGRFAIRELIIILSAVLSFGFLVRGAGLVVAAVVLVMLSCYASPKFRWGPSLLLAIGLTVFCVLVFVKLLGVPLPVFGSWFGV
jgi:hypothetical protein